MAKELNGKDVTTTTAVRLLFLYIMRFFGVGCAIVKK